MKISSGLQLLLTLSVAAILTACSGAQTTAPRGPDVGVAQDLAARGDHTGASRAYLDLAVAATGDQRQRYIIFAANELWLANDLEGADRILEQVGSPVAPANLELWAQVTAELRLAESDPRAALQVLNQVTSSQDPAAAARILLLRSDALFMLGRPETAVATLLQREAILRSNRDIVNNHRRIWAGLQATANKIPPDVGTRQGDPVLNGWLELGYLSYSNRASVSALARNIEAWRAANPDHPASGQLLSEVLAGLETLSNYPERVAMLLPLSGKQKSLGEAIRDGYLAAHFSLGDEGQRPDIRFFDTARNGAAAAYQQAVVSGTEFVVGPLLKAEVGELAALSGDVPVLALNYGAEELEYPERFYQFALAPEDEARAVANRAADLGYFNAVALVPQSAWGDRVLGTFQETLEERGGTLLAAERYTNETSDFADVIREILLLDESYARRERLAANIGKELEFKPRRRQDVDLVFVAADATRAKLLRPQLRFHYAADIPTFATSAIYRPGSTDNADLNGMLFPDMPWLLNPTQMVTYDKTVLTEYWGNGAESLARFYAMGYDAYHLSAMLNSARRPRNLKMPGMTGDLYMKRDGRLHRELSWAKMERGKPRTLPDAQRSLTQDAEIIIR